MHQPWLDTHACTKAHSLVLQDPFALLRLLEGVHTAIDMAKASRGQPRTTQSAVSKVESTAARLQKDEREGALRRHPGTYVVSQCCDKYRNTLGAYKAAVGSATCCNDRCDGTCIWLHVRPAILKSEWDSQALACSPA